MDDLRTEITVARNMLRGSIEASPVLKPYASSLVDTSVLGLKDASEVLAYYRLLAEVALTHEGFVLHLGKLMAQQRVIARLMQADNDGPRRFITQSEADK